MRAATAAKTAATPPGLPSEQDVKQLVWSASDDDEGSVSLAEAVELIDRRLARPVFETLNFVGEQTVTLADIGIVAVLAEDLEDKADELKRLADALRFAIGDLESIRSEGKNPNTPRLDPSGRRVS